MSDDETVLSFDPVVVRRRSPLNGEAIARILVAANIPLAVEVPADDGGWRKVVPKGEELEALKLALAAVADLCATYRIQRTQLPAPERIKIGKAFEDLMGLLENAHGARGGPPALPRAWVEEMVDWTSDSQDQQGQKKGRPADLVEPKIYRLLLSFYEVSFGVPPGSGAGGPTSRFLHAFFTEMHQKFSGSTYVQEAAHAPDLAVIFLPPSLEAIRNKIRQYKDADGRADEIRLVIGYCTLLHRRLGTMCTLQ